MLYEKADGTNRAACAFSINVSGNPTSLIVGQAPWSDGKAYFAYGGAGAGNIIGTASTITFGADRWVFSTGPRGMEIWQNGIKLASNSDNPTRTADGAPPFVLGASSPSAIFSDIAHYNLFCMWARQLTADEILMVSFDPYMLWTRP